MFPLTLPSDEEERRRREEAARASDPSSIPPRYPADDPLHGDATAQEKYGQAPPAYQVPKLDPNAEKAAASYGATVRAYTSPYRRSAEQKELAKDIIRTMPITDDMGNTVSPSNPAVADAVKQLKPNSRWKSAALAAFRLMGANPRLKNARDWSDVAGGVAEGVGGFAGGAINQHWDEEEKRTQVLARLDNEIKTDLQRADRDEMMQFRNETLEQRRENQAEQQKQKFLSEIRKRKHYDPMKVSEADRLQMAEYGLKPEDFGNWDDRNPTILKWGDGVFIWDNDKQAFVDPGLGKDASKTVVDYTITFPDGSKKVFQTTSDKAASLAEMARLRDATLELGRANLDERKRSNLANEELRKQQLQQAKDLAQQRITQADENIRIAKERLALAQADASADGQKNAQNAAGDLEKAKLAKIRLKAYLKNSPLIQADDDIWKEFDELEP